MNRIIVRFVLAVVGLTLIPMWTDAQAPQESTPIVVNMAVPYYPPLARTAHVQGEVRVKVTTDGQKVTAAKADNGHKTLADAAEQNARTWQFAPHAATTFTVTYRFKLVDDLKAGQNNPRVVLQLPTEVEVDTTRWPGTVDLSPELTPKRSQRNSTINHENLHAKD